MSNHLSPQRTQLIYLATARNYAKSGDVPLAKMYFGKANAALPVTDAQLLRFTRQFPANMPLADYYLPARNEGV